MNDLSNLHPASGEISPQQEVVGGFGAPSERTEESAFLSVPKQRKKDALDLAELIYDIFEDSLSSANIGDVSRKDDKNA